MHMYRTVVKNNGQLPYSALITRLFRHFNIHIPAPLCMQSIASMVIGLRMVTKMRLKEFSKALEGMKEKSPVKAK